MTGLVLYALTLGVGLAMDAFSVSVTNGMSSGKLRFRHALADGCTFGLFQGIMPLIGLFLGMNFLVYIEAVDHWIAFIWLAGIGGNMRRGALKKEEDEDPGNPYTGNTEAFITAGIIPVSTLMISTVGVYIGRFFGGLLKQKAELLGGLILIGIGLKILIEHLFF